MPARGSCRPRARSSAYRVPSVAPLGAAAAVLSLGACLADAHRPPAAATEAMLAAETADWAAATALAGSAASAADVAGPPSSQVSVDAVDTPLGTLLVALARESGLELAAHVALDAPVTIAAGPASLETVLERLAALAPFHWRIVRGRLVVRGDVPYAESYPVAYLNLDRSTRGSVGLATRVGRINAVDGASDGAANGSETRVESVAEHRFWDSLARDVAELLGSGGVAPRWSINRDAGLVTLYAGPLVHARLSRYLEALEASARRQVLIEATVVEVTLSDAFEAGIDWRLLARDGTGISAAQVLGGHASVARETVGRIAPPAALVSLMQRSGDAELGATLSLLERFGDVRVLSRPRIIALNNQSSVLKVVDNRVYFTLSVERRVGEEEEQVVTGTEIHTVPVGLVMNVTPFIDAGDAVTLNVRPTLSRILGFVDDPNPELALAQVTNGVPEIQVREMESMLRVASGEVAIIGGLMQSTLRDDERRLPGLAALPLVGRLFSRASRERLRTELLVMLRPTVLPSGRAAGDAEGGRG